MATTRSQSSSASSSSWVTSRTVVPASRSWETALHTSRRAAGSSPWVSSSRITSRGWFSRASTRKRRWRSPPLMRAEGVRPAVAEAEPLEQQVGVPGPASGEELDGLADAQPVGQARALELAADERPELLGVAQRLQPEHLDRAAVRPAQSLDALDGGGLAGAVGADQPDDLSGVHVEVEVVDDHAAAVRLGQAADRDHRSWVHGSMLREPGARHIGPRAELRLCPQGERVVEVLQLTGGVQPSR